LKAKPFVDTSIDSEYFSASTSLGCRLYLVILFLFLFWLGKEQTEEIRVQHGAKYRAKKSKW
jgi:hypothetical protein